MDMNELRLETRPARDENVLGDFLLATIQLSESDITVTIGEEGARRVSMIWSHTVYELEHLAAGLRFLATGSLPESYEVPSPDVLIGPSVGLWPALRFQLGHPGIGTKDGSIGAPGVTFFGSTRDLRKLGRKLVDLAVVYENESRQAVFEVEEALAFADWFYAQAKSLAVIHVGNGDLDE